MGVPAVGSGRQHLFSPLLFALMDMIWGKKKWLQEKKIWEILDPSSAKNLQNTMYLAFPHHSIQPHKYGCAFHGIIHSQAFHMTAKRPQLNEQNIVPLSSHSSRNSSCIHSQQRHTLSVYGPVSSFLSRENCDV